MSIAVLALSRGGRELAVRLAAALPAVEIYLPPALAEERGRPFPGGTLAGAVTALFGQVDGLILIAATGVAVRLIAPHLTDKRQDPGVVCVDEAGRFAISLLAGHVGAGNRLAEQVADALGAQPVLTTASERKGVTALDLWGRAFGWQLAPSEAARRVAAAWVRGDAVPVVQEAGPPFTQVDGWVEGTPVTIASARADLKQAACGVLISDGRDDEPLPQVARIWPKTLVAGVGCSSGVEAGEILELLERALEEAHLGRQSLAAIASIDVKQCEPGLLQAAERWALPVRWYPATTLAAVPGIRTPSAVVQRAVGTPSVCEAAALQAAGPGSVLALAKRKSAHATVALARQAEGLPMTLVHPAAGKGTGRLSLVGSGPGEEGQLTVRARTILREADVVVGYRRYLDLLRPWLGPKAYLDSRITQERERVELACDLAAAGLAVALVSSGDAGVYGMAGLAFEVLAARGWDGHQPEVAVVPGVTAATAAASLLGAPLMSDFAVISLSDLLTPWEVIRQRLIAAAKGDFVVVLYNPRSQRRSWQLTEATNIFLSERGPRTPVGVVRQAFRDEQMIGITTLGELLAQEIDMTTVVIVGNLATRVIQGRLVTPRGYPVPERQQEVRP